MSKKLYLCYAVISGVGSAEIAGGASLLFADSRAEALSRVEETVRASLAPSAHIKEIKSAAEEVPVSTIEEAAVDILGWSRPNLP